MRNLMKKSFGIIVTLALTFVFVLSMATGAQAETRTETHTDTTYFLKDGVHTWHLNSGDATKKSAVSNFKITGNAKCCTKPKVQVQKYGGKKYVDIQTQVKKPGKVSISYSVKQKNGDTIKYTYNFTFKYYSNPTASIKVGNKEYSSKFKKIDYIHTKAKNINGKKITVKPKKGYTFVGFSVYDGKEYKDYQNGAKISGLGKGGHVNMMMRDKKGGYNNVVIYIE